MDVRPYLRLELNIPVVKSGISIARDHAVLFLPAYIYILKTPCSIPRTRHQFSYPVSSPILVRHYF
jgi:hypothetical protein